MAVHPADENERVARKPIPALAFLLAAGTAVGLALLVIEAQHARGIATFFPSGDPLYFRLVAHSPFGNGHGFVVLRHTNEESYRYGRIGLPFLAWLLAAGRPGAIDATLVLVNACSIAAIPGLAAVLLDAYDVPPIAGAVVFLAPALLVLQKSVYSEPLVIAVVLLAYALEARGQTLGAIAALAAAILVKEPAALAIVPLAWMSWRRGELRAAVTWVSAAVPYLAWACYVRIRYGEFPFLARTYSRTGALRLPFVGIHGALHTHTAFHRSVVNVALITVVLCAIAAWLARDRPIGGCAAIFGLLAACLGPNTLAYAVEAVRVLTVPQVFGLIAIVVGVADHRARRSSSRRDAAPVDAPLPRDSRPTGVQSAIRLSDANPGL